MNQRLGIEEGRARREAVKTFLDRLQLDLSHKEGRLITKRELAEHLGILETTLGNWFKMVSLPSGESLRAAGEHYPELYFLVGQIPTHDKALAAALTTLGRTWPHMTEDKRKRLLGFLSDKGQTNETEHNILGSSSAAGGS